jgi:hypothetical protein
VEILFLIPHLLELLLDALLPLVVVMVVYMDKMVVLAVQVAEQGLTIHLNSREEDFRDKVIPVVTATLAVIQILLLEAEAARALLA